jgi:segregation and condensation protein A
VKVTVAEAVEELLDELPRAMRMTFRELTAALVDRIEIVVRFLAVLELYKQDLVDIDQMETFGDITVVWTGGSDIRARAMEIDVYDG